MSETWNAFGVEPDVEYADQGGGYDEGGYADEGYADEGPYRDPDTGQFAARPSDYFVDEYGDVDVDRFEEAADSIGQEALAQEHRAAQLRAAEEAVMAEHLVRAYPELDTEADTNSMLETLAELIDFQGSRDELLDIAISNPQAIQEVMEHQRGPGLFQKMWRDQNPGGAEGAARNFWMGSGGGGGLLT